MIRLLAFDLDGTALLEDHQHFSARTCEAFFKAAAMGIHVVPATGRIPKILPSQLLSMDFIQYAVCANGALVYDLKQNQALSSDMIPYCTSMQIMDVLKGHPLSLHIFSGEESYMDQAGVAQLEKQGAKKSVFTFLQDTHVVVKSLYESVRSKELPVSKITLPVMDETLQQDLWRQLEKIEGLCLTSSLPGNMEINSDKVSKGTGLNLLCNRLQIAPTQVMALGDSLNDLAMMQFVGLSVAMGNAEPEIKEASCRITDTNQNDGVAKAVEQFILSSN